MNYFAQKSHNATNDLSLDEKNHYYATLHLPVMEQNPDECLKCNFPAQYRVNRWPLEDSD